MRNGFEKRPIKIRLYSEAEKTYNQFQESSLMENAKGHANSFSTQLKKAIDQKIENLRANTQTGIHIPKRNIPKKLFEKYGANNFWKIDLPHYWRLIYTITGNKTEITVLILHIIDHDEYNKMFGYRKN